MGMVSPEAYERLLYDALRGDATLFTRWDEVKYSWIFTDSIRKIWDSKELNFPNYKSGTWGPSSANYMLEKDGRKWWVGSEEIQETTM
jgi:glucose-6-phosphate 1-dehydrogenase